MNQLRLEGSRVAGSGNIEQGSVLGNIDRLRYAAWLQSDIHSNLNARAHFNRFASDRREPTLLYHYAVITNWKVWRGIQTLLVCRKVDSAVGINADDLNLGARYDTTRLISHHALNRAPINLGA